MNLPMSLEDHTSDQVYMVQINEMGVRYVIFCLSFTSFRSDLRKIWSFTCDYRVAASGKKRIFG